MRSIWWVRFRFAHPTLSASASQQCEPAPRSGRARLRGVLGRSRLGAHGFSRACRPDAERPSRRGRCDRGFGLPEKRAAARRELRFVPDHADRDTVDIRNLRAAKPKRVRAARLLLLGRVGLACRRQHRKCERGCEHQAELEISGPDSKHESPRSAVCELWVNDGGLASGLRDRHA
jgi:hypothetical protein